MWAASGGGVGGTMMDTADDGWSIHSLPSSSSAAPAPSSSSTAWYGGSAFSSPQLSSSSSSAPLPSWSPQQSVFQQYQSTSPLSSSWQPSQPTTASPSWLSSFSSPPAHQPQPFWEQKQQPLSGQWSQPPQHHHVKQPNPPPPLLTQHPQPQQQQFAVPSPTSAWQPPQQPTSSSSSSPPQQQWPQPQPQQHQPWLVAAAPLQTAAPAQPIWPPIHQPHHQQPQQWPPPQPQQHQQQHQQQQQWPPSTQQPQQPQQQWAPVSFSPSSTTSSSWQPTTASSSVSAWNPSPTSFSSSSNTSYSAQPPAPSGNAVSDSLFAMFGAASRDVAAAAAIHKKHGQRSKGRHGKQHLANVHIPQFLDLDPTEPSPFPFFLMPGKHFKPHQIFIITWLWDICFKPLLGIYGALLCADMGLGKTLCGTAFMQLHKCLLPPDRVRWPGMVSCPLNLVQPWVDSAREFFGRSFRFLVVHDDWHESGFCEALRLQDVLQFDAIIMTYDSVIVAAKRYCAHETSAKTKNFEQLTPFQRHEDADGMLGLKMLMSVPWSTLLCDESQIFASGKTLVKALCALNGGPRICLSGTPIRNKSTDMFWQQKWLGYTGVDNPRHWNLSVYESHQCNTRVLVLDYAMAGVELPPMHEHKVYVEFSPEEREQYDSILQSNKQAIEKMEHHLAGVSFASILVLLTRLRQCCDAAYLITPPAKALQKCPEDAQMPVDVPGTIWVESIGGSAGVMASKMCRIRDIFAQVLIPQKRKCILFSNWRASLMIAKWALDPLLASAGCYGVLVDGKMPNARFEELLTAFKYDEKCLLLAMSYRKGANGLNLTQATGVICMDPWFSPAVHLQAIRRCWRIGQTKEVDCWWLYAKDTIEDRILQICHGKTQLSNAFLHGSSEEADAMATAEGGEEAGEADSEDGAKKQGSTRLNLDMIKSLLK